MDNSTQILSGGLQDTVHDSQAIFRMLMDSMARPGLIGTISAEIAPPKPLGIAAGAIMLTLCDHDTPVWLAPELASGDIREWLAFHCSAGLTQERRDARFAFAGTASPLPPFALLGIGTQEYPDRSSTLVLEVPSLKGGRKLALTGPGIRDVTQIAPKSLPTGFIGQWDENRSLFPRGIDVILTAGRHLVALPRTCKITPLEA